MNFLFVLRHAFIVRNFEFTIRELVSRGHQVQLLFTSSKKGVDTVAVEKLCKDLGRVSYSFLPPAPKWWKLWHWPPRILKDCARYFEPSYSNAGVLRTRALDLLPPIVRGPVRLLLGIKILRVLLNKLASNMEKVFSYDQIVSEAVAKLNPNVVVVSPLVDFDYRALDVLKTCLFLNIKSGLCVASWDNLTNKGLIQIEPDFVTLWNQWMKDEAIQLHGIPAEKIFITGAGLFDEWFEREPEWTADEFANIIGLNFDQPYVLYLCSSGFVAGNEVPLVKEWVRQMREKSSCPILIRPHPANAAIWKDVSFEDTSVVVFPREGQQTNTSDARKMYFHTLYNARCIVGLNTSGFIEAGIVGRPTFTFFDERYARGQQETLHFHYLVEGGLLHVSSSLEGHIKAMMAYLTKLGSTSDLKKFISAFVRPQGLEVRGAVVLATILEAQAYKKINSDNSQADQSFSMSRGALH